MQTSCSGGSIANALRGLAHAQATLGADVVVVAARQDLEREETLDVVTWDPCLSLRGGNVGVTP